MKKKITLENLFKEKLNNQELSYSESLWEKLDQQLMPIREAQKKKEKSRFLVVFSLLLLVGTGAALLLFNQQKGNNTKGTTAQKQTAAHTVPVTNGSGNDLKNEIATGTTPGNETQTAIAKTTTPINTSGTDHSIQTGGQPQFSNFESKHGNSTEFLPRKKTRKNIGNSNSRSATKRNKNNQVTQPGEIKETPEEIVSDHQPIKEVPEVDKIIPETVKKDSETVITNETEIKKAVTNEPALTAKPNKPAKTSATKIYAAGGTNLSSSLKQPGYYAGVILEKTVDSKQIFIGLKLAHNSLNHQLISATKAGVFPQVTDALIDRLTTIQVPFGYSFRLNKKANSKTSFLNLGFEPTLLTGVRTIYYDDNGVPGGPRTQVVNSPLLKNAINRFNLSFIAGVKIPLGNNTALNLGAGYGLINITDKQYYNRNSNNNNLKYFQAGLLFRLR